jgi:hypothetical protein
MHKLVGSILPPSGLFGRDKLITRPCSTQSPIEDQVLSTNRYAIHIGCQAFSIRSDRMLSGLFCICTIQIRGPISDAGDLNDELK